MPPPKQPYLTSITDHITHTTKPRKTHESACEECGARPMQKSNDITQNMIPYN